MFLMKHEIVKATECDTMNIIENSQCLSRSFTRIVFYHFEHFVLKPELLKLIKFFIEKTSRKNDL